MENISEEMKEFISEAIEMLESAESLLLASDKGKKIEDIYAPVFRVFHSLKGASGMFELNDLQHHMHQLENILSSCQTRQNFTSGEITFFLRGIDAAQKLLRGQSIQFNYNLEDQPSTPIINEQKTSEEVNPHKEIVKQNSQQEKKSLGTAFIIDDEYGILEILQEILNSAGINTKIFEDPNEAIKEIRTKPPELIISDMKMPQISGLEVLKEVKKINPDIPVIFISGHLNKQILLDSINDGAYAAIEKPFKENDVISICHNALKVSQISRLLNKSINLILYQFTDLEDYLVSQGKKDFAERLRNELQMLMEQRKEFRRFKKRS